jgi:hypothetical protein
MSTIRQMLPSVAQPFTEVIVGAGLGALVSKFVVGRRASTGALVGALAGYGLALTKAKGVWPLSLTAGGSYVGDSVYQFPTKQMGFVQPYQGMQQPDVDVDAEVEVQPEVIEEIVQPEYVPQYVPERHRRRREQFYGRSPYRHYGHGWGHHHHW